LFQYAVVDVETSGFHPPRAEILEVAVVLVDASGRITGSWDSLIRPEGGVGATHVHGISLMMVQEAPRFGEIAARLRELLAGRIVVAHNLRFDAEFLMAELGRAGISAPEIGNGVCTLRLAQRYLPGPTHKLAACCDQAGIELVDAHKALGDATATAKLLGHFIARGADIAGVPVRALPAAALDRIPAPAARRVSR
jgi:DNA polymerase-3 subunit epsilon